MKRKPDLSFWKLWNLSFGFFGVQIAYALQSANVSRIFTTIGADPHDLSYFWILPPLMGLLVQPIVGIMSDRTWNRFGRRLPYLIIGALIAVIVMCMLPNSGSFHFTVSAAILFGLVALMLLDTSINMAMQPFKMLVGDMVNEEQKAKAYSIQSFLCNAGSVMGYVFPFLLGWIGIQNVAESGVVPPTVIWSFYLGAAILLICVVYSLIKIKEWPPQVYAEYNGGGETTGKSGKKEKNGNVITLLKNAPSTFWSVGLVQFFCWFAFLFLWTYATNTVAHNAFDTPTAQTVTGLSVNGKTYEGKYVVLNDTTLIIEHGNVAVAGLKLADGTFMAAKNIVTASGDTIVSDHRLSGAAAGIYSLNAPLEGAGALTVDGTTLEATEGAVLTGYLAVTPGPARLTFASILVNNADGSFTVEEAETIDVANPAGCVYETKTVLDASTSQYNDAGNWLGLLYAVQAIGSVIWAVVLPRFRSKKLSYSLSLLLGAIGFIMFSFVTSKWILFIAFILIGCGWAAMRAWHFTILTYSLKGGNIGAYLGLFYCTICVPQIIAAIAGGWILSLMSAPGDLAPEYRMMLIAGIAIALGAVAVFFIKENDGKEDVTEHIPESDVI